MNETDRNEKINRALHFVLGRGCWHESGGRDVYGDCCRHCRNYFNASELPDYCNDISACLGNGGLVEWMRRERLGSFRISDTYSPYAWCVSIDGSDGNEIAHAEHEFLPIAISLAAVRALGLEKEV